jgi:hypothetical protein
MRKQLYSLLFLLFFFIGCGPSGGEPGADVQDSAATQAILATATTEITAVPEPTSTSEPAPATEPTAEPNADSEETAVSDDGSPAAFSPATTVAEAAVVREQDQVLGAADPLVTIVEYGDFQ